ncbi:DDB1- and CUL4-associated factor 13 [Bradysia coprophila]|uniref:DDB1- and CUL4-associated factor 13 n=1 Tax=Bradysia coprophila TaxID=38358 RepID=UPI00187D94B9|nr:DDB1- and CUL4-associated factor 13 [Bradysia coprophila]
MKVKMISRNPDEYMRETKRDIHKVKRNYDPSLHPLESAREYVRALNATKLDRVFAKPFIGNLEGHKDGVSCFAKHPSSLSDLCSGSYDGGIHVWNLPTRKSVRNFVAHDGYVRAICYTPSAEHFLSVGDDKTIKVWKSQLGDAEDVPTNTMLSRTILTGISHHRSDSIFATCGEVCSLWDETRNEPLKQLKWGVDTLHSISFNPIETSLLACCASDRSIIFYDVRDGNPLRKMVMTHRPNKISWNPMEAFNFTVANEDYNLYTFDSRRLKYPIKIHRDHISAVTDVDYSPTGKEFVSGGYDKTIRIYEAHKEHSREIYHTKRMQRITCVGWCLDNKYIFSGSDEMNIRLWKARASEKLGALRPRERTALNYAETLKEKYAAHPQIRRIANHRQVPKYIYNNMRKHRAIHEKEKQKEHNRRVHSKPGAVPFVPETRKHVLQEHE